MSTEDKKFTDPKNLGANALYPKHLFAAAGAEDDGAHVIAWHGRTPIYNTYIEVANEEQEEEKLAEGYSLVPVIPERDTKVAPAKASKGPAATKGEKKGAEPKGPAATKGE